jgi:hypothetical protein
MGTVYIEATGKGNRRRAPAFTFLNLKCRKTAAILKEKIIITVENRRLVWNYGKTCLAEYFLEQKGPAAKKVPGGFWEPVENCFLIKTKDGVKPIKESH